MTIENDYVSFYIKGWFMGWMNFMRWTCSELPALEIAENGDDHGQMYLSLAFSYASTPRDGLLKHLFKTDSL